MKYLKWGIGLLLGIVAVGALFLYLRYGGGQPYSYEPGPPLLEKSALETVIAYPEPIGNVAVSQDSNARVFFTIHPESRPGPTKLLEIIEGQAEPYPSVVAQKELITPLGLYVDQQQRLWVIDHGNHGFDGARLLAYDLQRDTKILEYIFPPEVAEKGSFFNDLSVTPDGRYVFVADVSFFGKKPSLIVFDVRQQRARSLLDGHHSVTNQGYLPVTPSKKMRFFGGLVDLMPGIDGLDVSPDGQFVYYAAMSHDSLYRVPVAACTDFDNDNVAQSVEAIGRKPLSDGIRVGDDHTTYITDVEHQGVAVVGPNGETETLIQHENIRWADGLSFGGDGYCYLADSAIPEQMLRSKTHMERQKPYYIFRFRVP